MKSGTVQGNPSFVDIRFAMYHVDDHLSYSKEVTGPFYYVAIIKELNSLIWDGALGPRSVLS